MGGQKNITVCKKKKSTRHPSVVAGWVYRRLLSESPNALQNTLEQKLLLSGKKAVHFNCKPRETWKHLS